MSDASADPAPDDQAVNGTGARVGRRLGYLLKHAEAELEGLSQPALAPFGIDSRDLGVLLVIDSFEPASQQDLAARMRIDRTSMVGRLDQLEAKGLVLRRADANDRRRNVVALTPRGESVLARATAASDAAEAELLAALTPQETEQLREMLGRVVRSRMASRL